VEPTAVTHGEEAGKSGANMDVVPNKLSSYT
jgi:hypothetical protein